MSRIQIEFLFNTETAEQAATRVERARILMSQFGGSFVEGGSEFDEQNMQRVILYALFDRTVDRIREDFLRELTIPEPRGCQATRVVDVTPIPPTILPLDSQ